MRILLVTLLIGSLSEALKTGTAGSRASRRDRIQPMSKKILFGTEHHHDWIPIRHRNRPRNNTHSGFIVNGEDAKWAEQPYLISLQVYSRSRNLWVHICGGFILSTKVCVTAAHCLVYWRYNYRHRVSAAWHILEEGANPYQQNIEVKRIYIHEDYDAASTTGVSPNDIAELYLEEELKLGRYVYPAVLATPESDFVGQTCKLVGWGRTLGYSSTRPDTLQLANIPIIPLGLCRQLWALSRATVENTNMCGYSSQNGTAPVVCACNGDSGGPLVCNNIVVGIVSWGRIGCQGCSPDVYTDIAKFFDWIFDNERR